MLAKTKFTDDEIIVALRIAFAGGADRENVGDRLQPPNLLAFFNNLPRPERDRLIGVATTSVGTTTSAPARQQGSQSKATAQSATKPKK